MHNTHQRERERETEGALERALDFEIEGGKKERMKAEQKSWGRSRDTESKGDRIGRDRVCRRQRERVRETMQRETQYERLCNCRQHLAVSPCLDLISAV